MVGIELPVLAMEHHYLHHRRHPGTAGPRPGDRQHDRLRRRDLHAPGARRRADRHLRAARQGLVAGADARRFLDAAAARRVRAPRARTSRSASSISRRSAAPASARRSTGRSRSRPTAIRWSGPVRGLAQLLGGLRRHGRLQPGRRHRPRAVALDGGGRSRARTSCRWTSRASARSRRRSTRRSRCRRTTRAASASPIRTRNCRPRGRCAARRSTTSSCAAGAVMGANFGLEHALWFAPPGMSRRSRRRPIAAPRRSRSCAPNARPCAAAAGLYETTNYGKYEVTGRGARAWLDRVFASPHSAAGPARPRADAESGGPHRRRPLDRLPRRGSLLHRRLGLCRGVPPALVLGTRTAGGRVRALGRLDAVRVFASPARMRATSLQRLVREDLSAAAFKLFHVRETAVGYAPSILTRAGFTGELGYEIWTTPDYFASLYDDLLEAGRDHRPRALRRSRAVVAAARERLRLVQQGLPARLTRRRDRARSLRRFRQARLHRARRRARRTRGGPEAPLRRHGGRRPAMRTSSATSRS